MNVRITGVCIYPCGHFNGRELQKQRAQIPERTSENIFGILRCTKQSSRVRGSPGGSNYENLDLELEKSFSPNRREIRIPEYRRGIKAPNTPNGDVGL